MSKVILPPGKKPLPVIRRVSDPVDQIEDYAKLLEWLLVIHVSGPAEGEELGFLGEHVQQHANKFWNIRLVKEAVGVYNDIKHAKPAKGRPQPSEEKIECAADNLERAVLEILPHVPEPVRRAVKRDPRFWGIPPGVFHAAAILFGLAVLTLLVAKIDDFGKSKRQTAWKNEDPEVRLRYAKQAQRQAENLASNVIAALDSLEKEQTDWDSFASKLLINDAGRRLAQSNDALQETADLLVRPRISADELKSMRTKVAAMIEPIHRALEDSRADLYPQDSVLRELEVLRGRASEFTRGYRDDADRISTLLARLPAAAIGPRTLQQAIDELRETDRLAKVEAERKSAEEVVRLKAEKAKIMEARRRDYQKKLEADRAEYRRLRALAESPDIREKFQPFLGQGVRFPRVNRRSVSWQNEAGRQPGPPRPIGYAWLKSVGVLDSADAMIAVATNAKNDRGAWPAPTTEAELKEFRDRFAILKELAPVWHDMGLLGPRPERAHHPDPDELASRVSAFEGQWRAVKENYDIALIGDVAVTIRSENPKNPVGADMLRIEWVIENRFSGSHYFQDGNWRPVVGELTRPNQIQLTTDGYSWVMERIPTGPMP